MNTYRRNRRINPFPVALVASLLAVVGLVAGLAPSASAQVVPRNIQFFDAIGDGTALYSVSPDAVLHTPEGEFVGRAGLTEFGDELEGSFTHLAFATTSVETAGSRTIVSFTLTGINTGSYHGLVANCAGISVPGVAVLQLNQANPSSDGEFRQDAEGALNRVAEQWISYDEAQITSQISAVNLMDPKDRPGCAEHAVTVIENANDDLPPVSPLPLTSGNPY